jgi:hypothetical protein
MHSPPSTEEQPVTTELQPQPTTSSSVNSSSSIRHASISLSAVALIIAFFLPWINFLGVDLNGFEIQKHFSSYRLIWLMPVLAVVVLLLNTFRLDTTFIRCVAGLCPFGILIYTLSRLDDQVLLRASELLLNELKLGGWLTFAAGVALIAIRGNPTK